MDYLEAKINQLVVEPQTKSKTFVRTFVTKPNRNLLTKMGKVFGLIEIESQDKKIPELIDLIIEEIKNNYYYQNENKIQQNEPTISEKFETALKKINLIITSFLESEQISLDLEKVNITIALSLNQDIHFTLVGDMGMILFYNTSPYNYRIINILETTQSPLTPPDPLKFFSQIISGKVRPRDILLLTTANIFDYFSLEKIKNILTGKITTEGIIELNEALKNIGGKETFGVLSLELEKITVQPKTPVAVNLKRFDYRQAASQDSIKELIKTEKETQKLLTPSLLPELKKYVFSFNIAFKNYLKKIKTQTSSLYQNKKVIIKPAINITNQLNLGKKIKTFNQIGNTYSKKILQPIILVFKKIIAWISQNPFWDMVSPSIKKIINYFVNKFNKLPKSSKILLVVTIILIILLSQSLIWLNYKNKQTERNERFNQIIFEAENKKNEAEASLIYRDEDQARQILMAIREKLAGAKPISKSQSEQIKVLDQQVEEKLKELRHLIDITEPLQVVNFQNLDSQIKIPDLLILNQKNLYTPNQNNQSISKANLDTRVISAILPSNSNTGNLAFGISVSNNEIVFLNDSLASFLLNSADETVKPISIKLKENAKIIDIIAYNNRLYLLDNSNKQIYRFDKVSGGYGDTTDWLKEKFDLSNARSFTIDGSIYVLLADGQIVQFLNGKKTDFKIKTVEPALQSPTKIKTTENSKYLYILDPPTKRLVVVSKEGNLINQYASEYFNDLKDFVVIEAEKKIYLLNGTSIFGIPAQHLK